MELTMKQILVLISNIHLLLPVTAIMGPIKFQPCEQNALHFTDRCHYLSDCVDGHCECFKHSIRLVYNKNGEGFCKQQNKREELKKHWKSLRDKYKRAKGKYDFFVEQSGGKDTSLASYFMKEHLFFLDPHLQDRRKISDNGRQEENDPLLEVALNIIDGTNCTSESPLKKKKKKKDKTETDEDLLFMRSLIPSMKRITNSYTKSVVKMTIMKIIHEAVYLNKVEVHHIENDEPCAEGSVRVLNNTGIVTYCAEVHYQNPLDQCHVELDKAYLCDPKAMTYCSNKKCKCFDGFKYNFNSTKCERNEKGEKSYVDQYCDEKGQCVEGLTCSQSIMQCKCPSPCVYLEDKAVCDCGKLDFPTPVGVTVTGVILSIMSVIFWSCLINKTINYPKRPDELNNEEPTEMDAPLDHSRYSPSVQLQPIQTPHDNIPSNDLPPSYNQVIAERSPAVGWSNIPKHNDSELPSYSLPLKTADSNLPYQLSPSIPEPNPSPFQPNPSPFQPNPSPFQPNPSPFQPNPSPFQPNPSPSQPNPLPHQLNPSAPQMNK